MRSPPTALRLYCCCTWFCFWCCPRICFSYRNVDILKKRNRALYFWHTRISGKCQNLGPWAINEKTKDTLLSQTLKVEEKKVSLVFLFVVQEPRYWPFLPLTIAQTLHPGFKRRNVHISALNQKKKSKVTLLFWFVVKEPWCKHFFLWS